MPRKFSKVEQNYLIANSDKPKKTLAKELGCTQAEVVKFLASAPKKKPKGHAVIDPAADIDATDGKEAFLKKYGDTATPCSK